MELVSLSENPGSLSFLEPYEPVQACTGTAFVRSVHCFSVYVSVYRKYTKCLYIESVLL
jgi:hypothetical protein